MGDRPERPSLSDVPQLFSRFESDELRRLDVFCRSAAKAGRSRLFALGDQLGEAPRLEIFKHASPGSRGEGKITTRTASADVREGAWAALRKLRTASNACSTAGIRNLLYRHAREAERERPELAAIRAMQLWLRAFKRDIESIEKGEALVRTSVLHGTARREYRTGGDLLNLAQNADAFHDDLDKLDDLETFSPLIEPGLDRDLLAHARLALELAEVADVVLCEPALVLR
jgi:hypothetical protein